MAVYEEYPLKTTMEVIECILTRRSIRKYLDLPLEWEKVGMILDAGRMAPSAGNVQCWKFLIVRNYAVRKVLAEAAMNQTWMEQAPVHIVVCAEMSKIKRYYSMRGEMLYAIQDCALASENMMLAAHALGLGSCFVAAFNEATVSRVLGIPDDARPQAIITLGYPDERPETPLRYRLENCAYIEGWRSRVGDAEAVLWSFRLAERIPRGAKDTLSVLEKVMKHKAKKSDFLDKIRDMFKKK